MFRENVLIALTILITILALSFVILLTVYMQLHQMDERIKRIEDEEKDISVPERTANDVISPPIDEQTLYLANYDAGPISHPVDQEHDKDNPIFNIKVPVTTKRATSAKTSLPTTENPDDEGFYTDDDFFLQFPHAPANSRSIPYNLYRRNGHVILEVPPSIDIRKDMDHLQKVLDELNELHYVQKERDEEQRQFSINGYKSWYPLTKERQMGQVWIRNTPITTVAPKRREPVDDDEIFNMAAQNHLRRMGISDDLFSIFGRRRKRSLRGNLIKRFSGVSRQARKA